MIATGKYTATLTNSGVQQICHFIVNDQTMLGVELAVTTFLLSAFEIHGRMHRDGSFWKLKSVAGDYTSPTGVLKGASGDLTIQAVGSGFFLLDVAGFESVKLMGTSGNAGGSGLTIYTRLQ